MAFLLFPGRPLFTASVRCQWRPTTSASKSARAGRQLLRSAPVRFQGRPHGIALRPGLLLPCPLLSRSSPSFFSLSHPWLPLLAGAYPSSVWEGTGAGTCNACMQGGSRHGTIAVVSPTVPRTSTTTAARPGTTPSDSELADALDMFSSLRVCVSERT
jgi:hypothetical protein